MISLPLFFYVSIQFDKKTLSRSIFLWKNISIIHFIIYRGIIMKTIQTLFILIVLFISTFTIPLEQAKDISALYVWTVNQDGTADFLTIQDAIDVASSGDIINIYPGVYFENINIDKDLRLIGQDKTTTVIDGSLQQDVISINADQVHLSNLTIQHSGPSGRDAAIQIEANAVTIADTIITNSTIGIFLHNAHDNIISQNMIQSCKDYGINFNNAHRNQILENDIRNNRWGSLITLSFGNQFQSNDISHNSVHGIWILRHAVYNIIKSNTISDNGAHGILIQLASFNNSIQDNLIQNNGDCGIQVGLYWPCDDIIIMDNTIKNNDRCGVEIKDSHRCQIQSNNFIDNSIPATFLDITLCQWEGNYWSHTTQLPVIISGRYQRLPWINIDWHPSTTPYELPSTQDPIEQENNRYEEEPKLDLPASFSWKNVNGTNYLSPVKNQIPAPTCETYALCCSLETQVKRQVGADYDCDLSEVHLFFYSGGTNEWGVDINEPAEYLVNWGVPDEGCFPDPHRPYNFDFQSLPGWEDRTVKINEWGWVDNEENAIKEALITYGPLVICQMTRKDLDMYTGGVYMPNINSPIQRGHVVAITGYDDQEKCWIIRNSAGEDWGEHGYFRIRYDAFDPSYSFIFPYYGGTGILYVDGIHGNLMPEVPRIYIETPDLFTTYLNEMSFPTVLPYLSSIQRAAPRIIGSVPIELSTIDAQEVFYYIDGDLIHHDEIYPFDYTLDLTPGLHTLEVIGSNGQSQSKDERDIFFLK